MATTIRMKRGGRSHKPYYRIVVIDSRHRDGGPEVDILGIYHPCARPEPVTEVNVHKALDWLRKGATASDTAKSVLRKLGVYKHLHEGTTPEEAVGVSKAAPVEKKGYTAPQLKSRKKKQAPAESAGGGEEAAE